MASEPFELLPEALAGAGLGVWDLRVPERRLRFDAVWAAILGEEGAGEADLDGFLGRIHDDDRDAVLAAVRAHLEGRTPAYLVECRTRRRDGTWVWTSALAHVVRRDDAGRPLRLVGTLRDVSERRAALEARERTEARLRASEARFRTFVASARDQVVCFECDPPIDLRRPVPAQYEALLDARLVECNEPYARAHGAPRDALLGRSFREVTRAGREVLEALYGRLVEQRFAVDEALMTIPQSDGTERRLLARLHGTTEDDRLVRVWGSFTDVTARLEAEALRHQSQKLEALGLLAGGVAHEFNNLLTAILGQAELLQGRELDGARHAEAVEAIQVAGRRAAELTRDLLAFGRRGALGRVDVDVRAVLGETARLLSQTLGRNIAIVTELGEVPLRVEADPALFASALLNLAVNARDAMPDGGTLTLRAAPCEVTGPVAGGSEVPAPGRYVALSVVDTGTGIAPDVLPHLFEPFFTTRALGQGTGLGLAAVHGFVHGLGGVLRVETAVGQGSTFHLLLPRVPDRPGAEAPQARGPTTGARVLVIDDEASVANVVRRGLERAGYAVEVAHSGDEGLRSVAETPFDLVLLDLNMPGMTGAEVLRQLRGRDPHVPVVVCSGFGTAEVAEGVRDLGVAGFLHKPFRLGELSRVVSEHVGRKA
jgi:signal transduction histidine kinase